MSLRLKIAVNLVGPEFGEGATVRAATVNSLRGPCIIIARGLAPYMALIYFYAATR